MLNLYCKKNFINVLIILFVITSFPGCKKDQITNIEKTTDNKMYVYTYSGNTFYLVDYKTYEVIREIKLDLPDYIFLRGMILSTNRDHLILAATDVSSNTTYKEGFVTYDINNDKIDNVYFSGFTNGGPTNLLPAQSNSLPGLIYVSYRDLGIYLINVFERKVVKLISGEYSFNIFKDLIHSPDGKWDVILKSFGTRPYTEIEAYKANTDFTDLQFVLNQDNKDSINVYYPSGIAFSQDNRLFVSYQPSGGNANTAAYIGVYDLNTGQFIRTSLKLPWSLTSYNIAYNVRRNELYDVGFNGLFYIIDAETYIIKQTINLSALYGQSPIVLGPDNNVAYVGFPESNLVFVIDLDNRQIIKKIAIPKAYNIIIP